MSRTIGSPARITRSDASWCGDAEFGPRRDDRELGVLVALGEEPLADLARDVGLRPADERPGGDLVDDAVGGRGGEAEELDLVGVLRHPQRRGAPSSPTRTTRPAARAWRRSRWSDQSRSETPTRDGAVGHAAARRRGDERRADPRFPSRSRSRLSTRLPASRGGLLEPRHDERRRPGRAHRRRASSAARAASRVVAGEVAEVRPDADEQRVEARLRRPHVRPRRSRASIALGGDRRSRRRPSSAGRRDRQRPSQRRDRRRAVLEQLAVGEDLVGAGVEGPPAERRVVVLADGQDPRARPRPRGATATTPS